MTIYKLEQIACAACGPSPERDSGLRHRVPQPAARPGFIDSKVAQIDLSGLRLRLSCCFRLIEDLLYLQPPHTGRDFPLEGIANAVTQHGGADGGQN
jgi:hypothetical protein